MSIFPRLLGVAGMVLLLAVTSRAAAQSQKGTTEPKPTAPEKDKQESKGIDSLKNLPPGAIVVVVENVKEAKRLAPDLILLTPKQYQELRDKVTQLETQSQPEETIPAECHLTGAVEGEVAHLHAEFKLVTERDREHVLLGCRLGQPVAVSLDGKLPALRPTGRGLVLQVDKKGEHVAQLDLEVNVVAKGNRSSERGLDLDLPGAAVTSLHLNLAEGVKEVAVGVTGPGRTGSVLTPTRAEGKGRVLSQQLGTVTNLELSWKGPVPTSKAPPLLTAQGLISVRLFEQQVLTRAELTLQAQGQAVSQWRLHVPPAAQVTIKSPGSEDRPLAEVESPGGADPTLRVVRLKEPSTDPVLIVVEMEQPRGTGPIAVGPFAAEGAGRQRGDVRVAVSEEARVRVQAHGPINPREPTPEEQRAGFRAAFNYWNMPKPAQAGQPFPPLLEIEADISRGSVAARLEHRLERTDDGWKLITMIKATPPLAGTDSLRIKLPTDYRLVATSPRMGEPGYSVTTDNKTRSAEIKFDQKQTKPLQISLEGNYPPPPEGAHQTALELPQLQQAVSGGPSQITIVLKENADLELPRDREAGWEVTRTQYYSQTWKSDQLPGRIEITWQPHRQELLLAGVADIMLSGRTAQVVQQLWFDSSQAPADVRFRVPDLANDVVVMERGEWNPATRLITLAKDASEKRPLKVRYSFPLPTDQGGGGTTPTLPVPLITPSQEAHCESKLRISTNTGVLVERASGPWEELPLEPIADGTRLASLVLRGDRLDQPPSIRLREAASFTTLGIERALIRVLITDLGQQTYHASFVLHQGDARFLEIEFPAPPANLSLRAALGGLPVAWGPAEESSRPAQVRDASRLARIPLNAGFAQKTVRLDLWYQLGAGQVPVRPPWTRALGPVQSMLIPPRLAGWANRASVRWQIMLPPDWVPLAEDGEFPADQTWGWRGWLLAARPALSAGDLERWLAEADSRSGSEETENPIPPSVVIWSTDLAPLSLHHVPQQAWLLGCSLVVLLGGFFLYLLRARWFVFWATLLALGGSLVALGLFFPGVLPALVYGCEPGMLALLAVLGLQWLLHQRYRRQVVFLPSFKRVRPSGSSLIHKGSSSRPREPSTVDALPPISSGQWATEGPSPSVAGKTAGASSQTKGLQSEK